MKTNIKRREIVKHCLVVLLFILSFILWFIGSAYANPRPQRDLVKSDTLWFGENLYFVSDDKGVRKEFVYIDSTYADLNDYFGTPGDGIDWNFTEISDEWYQRIVNMGLYFDTKLGYWRKK